MLLPSPDDPAPRARILIVDDHLDFLHNLREILEGEGFRVDAQATVAAALASFGAAPSDVALLDLRLPDGDGLSLLRRLRELAPELPAVVLTGNADLDSAVAAMRAGAKGYLRKGAPVEEILSTVRTMVRTLDLERRLAEAQVEAEERRALAAVGEVVSGVAHEIQNPVQNIVMGVDLIRHRMGKESLVVQAAVDETRGRSEAAGIEPVWRPADEALTVEADAGRLKQVFVNLLVNAIEASPRGGRVGVHLTPAAEGGAEVAFTDSGPGMSGHVSTSLAV